jgi:CRISPR-associated protein Cmr2
MKEEIWALKTVAFLHDPPDKVLGIEGHQKRAKEWLQLLLGREPSDEETNRAKKADQVASAMDRAAFPYELKVSSEEFRENPAIRHPLSGRLMTLDAILWADIEKTIPAPLDVALQKIKEKSKDLCQLYFLLWRSLQGEIRRAEKSGLGTQWALLPPDTRIIDHSIWEHADVSAALVTALPKPCLLVFSIGPVQSFIATARRTQDLWMGSYILSYLIWRAMETIVEEFGPDTILYPSLRGQPLVDHWLATKTLKELFPKPEADDMTMATLPNRLVALLPWDEALKMADKAKEAVQDAWLEVSRGVQMELMKKGVMPLEGRWLEIWNEQVPQFPEIYWAVHPWPDTSKFERTQEEADAVKKEFENLLNPPADWHFERIYKVYSDTWPEGINVGTAYSLLHDLAQRGLEARKGLRDFKPVEEKGHKCTLCGERTVLHGKDGTRRGVRDFWDKVVSNLQSPRLNRWAEVKPEGQERLCAICTIKRFVQREFFEDEKRLGLRRGFPSTSHVATVSFQARLLEKLADLSATELWESFAAFVQALDKANVPRTVAERAIPYLNELVERSPKERQDMAREFVGHDTRLGYDGRLLFPEIYTLERLKREFNIELSEEKLEELRGKLERLRKAASDVRLPLPSRYYAILMMDGDHMGRWLMGEFAPRFAQTLHPKAAEDLWFIRGWGKALNRRRLVSPGLHVAISHALANFALRMVRWVVEERHPGRVVYAGGDDILALLPIEHALEAARELRALFSGEAIINEEGDIAVTFQDPDHIGFLRKDGELLLTMGPKATASIGIAISHHISPLSAALETARRAERSAKENYGRNAICVHFLRRSGEELRVGTKWFYDEGPEDAISLILDVRRRFSEKRLSMKLAHALYEEAPALAALPEEAQEAELERLMIRHKGERMGAEEAEKQAREMAPALTKLANSLNAHCRVGERTHETLRPAPGMVELAKWMLLARFLAQGGMG